MKHTLRILTATRNLLEGVPVFLAVAEARSFTRAARRLGISPSAASQAVRALEEKVGSPLLMRSTRSLNELTTLACPLLAIGDVAAGAQAWMNGPSATGTLLGCWRTEIGTLGRLLILRGFGTRDDLSAERGRALSSERPFNADGTVTALSMEDYARFPFLAEVRVGARGAVYEFRTYRLKPGGLPPTLAGWQEAIGPAGEYTATS